MDAENNQQALTTEECKCNNCGGVVKFKPGSTSLVCIYCGQTQEIDAQKPVFVNELDFNIYASSFENLNLESVKVFSCGKCGAESTFSESVKSSNCPYCTSPLVEKDAHDERLIKPGYVLPFQVEEEMIRIHLDKWLKSLWFAPNKLKKQAIDSNMRQGVYTPCWTYDANTETDYEGERGDDYTVTVGSGKNQRTETRTRWRYASGHIKLFFDDVMVSASRMVPTKIFNLISHFDTNNMLEYDNRFLSGFITEKYAINLNQGYAEAKQIMDFQIIEAINDDIGCDHQRITSCDTPISDVTFKLILLPFYISSYTYDNKLFHYYVNGRTGKITGNRPYSSIKIAFAIILGVALLSLIVYFFSQNNS